MDPQTYVDPQLTTADRLVIDAVITDPAAKGTSPVALVNCEHTLTDIR
jgi:hypothetical protein